jgi:CheY-like chemotaxis protein
MPRKSPSTGGWTPRSWTRSAIPRACNKWFGTFFSNAIKFTERGGRIYITMQRVDSRVEIAVQDNGMGMSPDLVQRVFERFHQKDGPTTREHGGLGLGLSIVKHLVELHGGTAHAASEGENKGSTFTISLPVSATRSLGFVPKVSGDESALGGPIDGTTLKGIRILIVEDEADTRDLIRRVIESHGAQVVLAADAGEAMKLLATRHPHILVSDIGLPGVDGYELIRRIRQLEAQGAQYIPAVALTAFARSEDRTRALRAGYQAHIAKPAEPAELIATLASFAQLLGRREN